MHWFNGALGFIHAGLPFFSLTFTDAKSSLFPLSSAQAEPPLFSLSFTHAEQPLFTQDPRERATRGAGARQRQGPPHRQRHLPK